MARTMKKKGSNDEMKEDAKGKSDDGNARHCQLLWDFAHGGQLGSMIAPS